MENSVEKELCRKSDSEIIRKLKEGDQESGYQFFYEEIIGILIRIQKVLFQGQVGLNELITELYLYLSEENWRKLDSFDGRNGCQLMTWMIPVAWRFFFKKRYLFEGINTGDESDISTLERADEELRIQIAIDVNAVLEKMQNKRYSDIIRRLIIEGYSASEVANILDTNIDNVYDITHRAIKQFISLYGNDRF